MAKFKLRIFRSCRSKDPSTLPEHPIQRHNIITVDFPPTTQPPPPSKPHQPHRSSFKSQVSSAFGCGSKSADLSDSDYFQWQEDDQWHVIAKIYDVESPRRKIYNSSVSGGDTDDDSFPLPLLPLPPVDKKKRRRGRRMKLNKLRNVSASSGDSGLFSSEYSIDERGEVDADGDGDGGGHGHVEEDETETLISSSRSFSTDSSTDFNPQLETIRESAPISVSNRYKLKKKRTASSKRNSISSRGNGGGGMMMMMCSGGGSSPEWGSPARLSVFKKVIPCKVDGKIKESFAVVKRSEDPYEDFKRSMMEMIMEKEMFEDSDLEQLLQCFLSLNSRFHHAVIVEAFSEIWDTMFRNDST